MKRLQLSQELKDFVNEVAEIAIDMFSIYDFTKSELIQEYTSQILEDDFSCLRSLAIELKIELPLELFYQGN